MQQVTVIGITGSAEISRKSCDFADLAVEFSNLARARVFYRPYNLGT